MIELLLMFPSHIQHNIKQKYYVWLLHNIDKVRVVGLSTVQCHIVYIRLVYSTVRDQTHCLCVEAPATCLFMERARLKRGICLTRSYEQRLYYKFQRFKSFYVLYLATAARNITLMMSCFWLTHWLGSWSKGVTHSFMSFSVINNHFLSTCTYW